MTQNLDLFAEIATQRLARRTDDLVEPEPLPFPDKELPLDAKPSTTRWRTSRKLATPEQLDAELARYRKQYAPYLRDLAPTLRSRRHSLSLDHMDWREETESDRRDFAEHTLKGKGSWKKVSIPHYGPPMGRAVTYYRTRFTLESGMFTPGSLWACFRGVDYKAHVFLNGSYLGSHEGFFAPFEFDFTAHARKGANTLVVKVENDVSMLGASSMGGMKVDGNKVYAAAGLGWDEPEDGWHLCKAGMGICQPVRIEARARTFIQDVFVRPLPDREEAEAWIEVHHCDQELTELSFDLSLYGQNFKRTVFRNRPHTPQGLQLPGHGDLDQHRRSVVAQPAGAGVNDYRISFPVPKAKRWDLDKPWLYQLQLTLNINNRPVDRARQTFGMRTFRQDETTAPKGKFYLNDREVRLRGANTMGHLQQCVFRGDHKQLVDDILLAKICGMNFIRLTQRPVQKEVYEACDRLGLMLQTDLPLFGKLRRNQMLEVVRQSQEAERLIRPHASSVMVSFINEPYPNAQGKPHRHLVRKELDIFFGKAARIIKETNPDRVVKCCDGDYDPPAPFGMPDNHCYCGWYIGHGTDLGKLHRGYWVPVAPGWHYGCGEFGSEGLDFHNTMERFYPRKWLPRNKSGRGWTPKVITDAQTEHFHYLWYETPDTLDEWIEASHEFQALITRTMTESFRRDARMNSFAIHLFIDAWPAGWMKTIMDTQRQPKPAYFTYRDALTPLMVSLRTDRTTCFSGEDIPVEAWVCNDLNSTPKGAKLKYRMVIGGKVIQSGSSRARIPSCRSEPQGRLPFRVPAVASRTPALIQLALVDSRGRVVHDTEIGLDIFPEPAEARKTVRILGARNGTAAQLARELGMRTKYGTTFRSSDTMLVDDPALYRRHAPAINKAVRDGATLVFLNLPEGEYGVAGDRVRIAEAGMGHRHFVSRKTGHPMVSDFEPNDFRFWFDAHAGYQSPILDTVINPHPEGWDMILQSGDGSWCEPWHPVPAAMERSLGQGVIRVCQVKLAGRTTHNPIAREFAQRLLNRA